MDKIKDYIKTLLKLAIQNNPEVLKVVRNAKATNLEVQNYNPNQKRDKKGRWTKENYNAEIDRILKGELKSADRIKVVEHPSAPWLKAGLQDAEMFMSVKTYGKATTDKHNVSEETMRNLPDLIDDPLYIFKSSTVPGSYVGVLDDYEEENGIKKPLIAVVKPENGEIDVNLIPSVYGKDPDFPYREVFKNNLLYERLDKNKTVSNNIIASIAMETLKPPNNIISDNYEDFNPNMNKHKIDNDKWITIHPNGEDSKGRPLLLKDGETPQDAIDRVYGKKGKFSQQYSFEGEKISVPYSEYKNKWENGGKYYTKGEYNQKDKTIELYRPWYAEEFENTFDNISSEIKQMEREYEKNKDDSSMREKVEEFKNKQKPKLKSIAQKIILDKLNRSTWNHANRVAYTFLLDELKQNEGLSYYIRRVEGNIAKDFVKNTLNEIFQSDEMKEFYKKNQNIGLSKEEKEKHKKITNSKEQNNKEQNMALLNELKKLITKVENDKGEDMDEKEKIKNEKVDKRKLIDEVAGIMKSAGADDEKIRTAIAKMEKLAYDKSEAGTADNECDDKEEVKNKKVKNEDGEDEKKYDDLKKDVKEDVENKCKNSVDNAKGGYFDKMNEIYNAAIAPKKENLYVSRADRLEAGKSY